MINSYSCINEFIKRVAKSDKMLGKPQMIHFPPTHLINSIKHDHLCKILYLLYITKMTVLGVKMSIFCHIYATLSCKSLYRGSYMSVHRKRDKM